MVLSSDQRFKLHVCSALLGASDSRIIQSNHDLKSGYHKAILRDHPDKGGSQESFLCLQAAFDAVQDYLASFADGDEALSLAGERAASAACTHPILSTIAGVYAWHVVHNIHDRTGCAPPLYVPLTVTLEDVYCRRIKKVVVSCVRRRIPRRSTLCVGAGTNFVDALDGEDTPEDDAWVSHRVVVYVPLDADALNDATYTFAGMGHDSMFCTSPVSRGDIVVELILAPHDVYEIDRVVSNADLHATIHVSIRDYYYGRRVVLPALDGEPANDIVIDYIGNSEQRIALFRGKGLPRRKQNDDSENDYNHTTNDERGDVFVFFNVSLPDIPASTLQKLHVRMFFEMLFGMMFRVQGSGAAL